MLTVPNYGRNPVIPVTFIHEGKQYKGQFSEVLGTGAYTWHLNINGFHWGRMVWVPVPVEPGTPIDRKDIKYHLAFHTQKGDIDYLEDEFIDLFISWY